MIFKFLQKPIHINAFVPENFSFANEWHPIVPSSKFIPPWWKNTPKSHFNFDEFKAIRTVKGCSGIIETFKNGYILPLWSDLAFSHSNEKDWKYQFADQMSTITPHINNQFQNFYTDHSFFKMDVPWLIETSENIKILTLDPFYLTNEPKPYVVPYGFLNTTMVLPLNFFLFVKKNQQYNHLLLKAGTPLLQIIPITEKPIKFTTEVLSERECKLKFNKTRLYTFAHSGLNSIKILNDRKKK